MTGGLFETPANEAQDEPEAIADARRFGFSEDEIERVRAHLRGSGPHMTHSHGVWPQNVEIVQAFLSVASQWRSVQVFGQKGSYLRRTGLDYPGVRASLDALAVEVTPDLWRGLQVMETAALERFDASTPAG